MQRAGDLCKRSNLTNPYSRSLEKVNFSPASKPAAMVKPQAFASPVSSLLSKRVDRTKLSHTSEAKQQPRQTPATVEWLVRKRANSTQSNCSTSNDNANKAICVAVRVRPCLKKEEDHPGAGEMAVAVDCLKNQIRLDLEDRCQLFRFDHCFDDSARPAVANEQSQLSLFNQLGAPMVEEALRGINCTLFAYGQTGTGKTYSIFGTPAEPGLIPRICKRLVGALSNLEGEKNQWQLDVSFYEIYNEKLRDLLVPEENRQPLKVRDHPDWGVYVQGLRVVPVRCFEEIQALVQIGSARRISACTVNNDRSSRSHALFVVKLKLVKKVTTCASSFYQTFSSCLNIVDLAGSERLVSDHRIRETSSINKSLATLGMVIDQLSENAKFISHRDSVLTWLLKESLGGNARTTMLTTVSPMRLHVDQTYNALRYANRAKRMTNQVRVNEDESAALLKKLTDELANKDRLLDNQQVELEDLRSQLVSSRTSEASNSTANRVSVQEVQLQYELEAQTAGMNIESALLKWPRQPFILLLSPDQQVSEGLVFCLYTGGNRVGSSNRCDVKINGAHVAPEHCVIAIDADGSATISPHKGHATFVNGQRVEEENLRLSQGDRVCLAGEQFFIFYNKATNNCHKTDGLLEKAKLEYLNIQNELLMNQLSSIGREDRRKQSEPNVTKRDASVQQDERVEKLFHPAITQTDQQTPTVSIAASKLLSGENIVSVDFMIREANAAMKKLGKSFRFSLAECRIEDGRDVQWTVTMSNQTVNSSVTLSLEEFKDNWTVLRSFHLGGKREHFAKMLDSMFFRPKSVDRATNRWSDSNFTIRASNEGRHSIASFLTEPFVETVLCGDGLTNETECLSPKTQIDWMLLSIGNMEVQLKTLESNPQLGMFPCMFGIRDLHLHAKILLSYPNRLPGITKAVGVLDLSICRFHNALMCLFNATRAASPIRSDQVEPLLPMLYHVAEALGSLAFLMPCVTGSHLLEGTCGECNLSSKIYFAFLRGAHYGFKHLSNIVRTLCDSQAAGGKPKMKALLFSLDRLMAVARVFKTYETHCHNETDVINGVWSAYCLLRPLMHCFCAASGFNDLTFRNEMIQAVDIFLKQLNQCHREVDKQILKSAFQAVYPHLTYLQTMENNHLLASEIGS